MFAVRVVVASIPVHDCLNIRRSFGLGEAAYKELAQRLGVSPDTARMKAVMVEVSSDDLNARINRSGGERSERARQPSAEGRKGERVNAMTDPFVKCISDGQERIRQLTDELLQAKDAHRRDGIALAAAEARRPQQRPT